MGFGRVPNQTYLKISGTFPSSLSIRDRQCLLSLGGTGWATAGSTRKAMYSGVRSAPAFARGRALTLDSFASGVWQEV